MLRQSMLPDWPPAQSLLDRLTPLIEPFYEQETIFIAQPEALKSLANEVREWDINALPPELTIVVRRILDMDAKIDSPTRADCGMLAFVKSGHPPERSVVVTTPEQTKTIRSAEVITEETRDLLDQITKPQLIPAEKKEQRECLPFTDNSFTFFETTVTLDIDDGSIPETVKTQIGEICFFIMHGNEGTALQRFRLWGETFRKIARKYKIDISFMDTIRTIAESHSAPTSVKKAND